MNRYVLAGVAADARAGKRVLVVSVTQAVQRWTFDEIAALCEGANLRHTNGYQRIHFDNGGEVRFISERSRAAGRGWSGDIVVVDFGVDDYAAMERFGPCIAASPAGEFIRP